MSENIIETRHCAHCIEAFSITEIDREFLQRLAPKIANMEFSIPFPTHCPKCRKIRRYAWRNEKNIYKRKCDATGKEIISLFSPDSPCPVYESDYWYSDKWDAHVFGRDFDFSKRFFDQWAELKKVVPVPGKIISPPLQNSDYSDNCGFLKDCYLVFNASRCENSYYSIDFYDSTYCMDSLGFIDCHECYEILNASNCYQVHFSYDVRSCKFSKFLYACVGCEYCYGCSDIKNQKYVIFNTQYDKTTYFDALKKIESQNIEYQKKLVQDFLSKIQYKILPAENRGSENVVDSTEVYNSKNIWNSNTIRDSEDIRYCKGLSDSRVVMDVDIWGDRLDNSYESIVVGESAECIYFSPDVWGNASHIFYSLFCVNNVHHCFGCIGLRNASYCILNKQYTKDEYESLVPKIIEKMRRDEEWGEFFPPGLSYFGYNQTMNMIKYPLSRDQALEQGFAWSDYEAPFPKVEKIIPGEKLPENIDDIPDDILNWAIECEVTKRPFRIIRQELEFYRKHRLPVPKRHPDTRYNARTKIYVNY